MKNKITTGYRVFLRCCASLTFVFLAVFAAVKFFSPMPQAQAQKMPLFENLADIKPLFPRDSANDLKELPKLVNSLKFAGATFERRELFEPTARRAADADAKLQDFISDGAVFNLQKAAIQRIFNEDVKYLALPLPATDGGSVELELVKVNIFAPGFLVKTFAPHNEKIDEQSLGVHYRGIVKGNERSVVAISIYPNEVMGFYSTETGGNVVLGRLGGKNSEDRHILYADRNLKVRPDFHCDTNDSGLPVLPESVLQQPDAILARCVKIYVEANYDLFLNKGNIANTQAYITGLFNQSATLFSNDGIPIALSQIGVWNTSSPYMGTGNSLEPKLQLFENNQTSFNGDLAHLLTLDNLGGIASSVYSLCNPRRHAVSSVDPSSIIPVPTYSQTVMVFTHETGHNLGSHHTHACAWNGNNTAIDACGPSAPVPGPYPYEGPGTCGNAPLPSSNGGTIMSYCHLLSNVGINFNLGFGQQPRDRILSRFNAATCLTDCGGGGNCTYNLSPTTSPTIAASGGSGSFSVAAGNSCSWTATSSVSWITVTSGSSGSGNGTVGYSVQANTGAARTGTITVAGQTFTVTQAAGSSGCPVTPIAFGQTVGGSLTTSDCVFPNTTRYADIYSFSGTAGQRIAVSMNSTAFDAYLFLINPSNQTVAENDDGGGGTNSRIPATSGYITLPATGTFTIYATSYTSNGVGGVGSYTVSLANEVACSYSISPSGQSISASGGNASVGVTAPAGCNWSAASNVSWISITSGTSGSGNGTVGYTVAANTGAARSGTLTVAGQTFTVNQSAGSSGCSVTPIAVGQTTNGALANCVFTGTTRHVDLYSFNGTAGQQITISMNAAFDTYLYLISPGGTLEAENDDIASGSNTNSRIPVSGFHTLQSTGAYTIRAAAYSSGVTGAYTLNLSSGTNPPLPRKNFDFDGDGKADVAVFRPANGVWYLNQSANGFTGIGFGQNGDKLVPADYDGDGKTDIAVYRNGTWYLYRSSLGFTGIGYGISTDIPVPADYDGDGKAELAVFRPSNGSWYIYNLAVNQNYGISFGASTDRPIPADYDGDGKADIAVYRTGTWYIQRTQLGFTGVGFGDANDKAVPADYDGDGKADIAVYRPSNGTWYLNRTQLGFIGMTFGISTDLPAPADFDGDGKADVAVYRDGTWYLNRSQAGFTGLTFGATSDLPISHAFVR